MLIIAHTAFPSQPEEMGWTIICEWQRGISLHFGTLASRVLGGLLNLPGCSGEDKKLNSEYAERLMGVDSGAGGARLTQ